MLLTKGNVYLILGGLFFFLAFLFVEMVRIFFYSSYFIFTFFLSLLSKIFDFARPKQTQVKTLQLKILIPHSTLTADTTKGKKKNT